MDELIAKLRNPAWSESDGQRLILEPERTVIDMALAADELERLRAERAWLPIETAPKDGTQIWGWDGEHMETIIWAGDPHSWLVTWSDADFLPTHWQPLPTPPVNRPGEPTGESKA